MRSLQDFISEGAGHIQHRLGAGSSGNVYDLGNGKVRKTMRVLTNAQSCREAEFDVIEHWAKIKSGLLVIPYIEDVDWDGYTIEKLDTPCPEGKMIEDAIWHYFWYTQTEDWPQDKIDKFIQKYGQDKYNWLKQWCDDFEHDWALIVPKKYRRGNDVRSLNIGKDKHGNVKIFDFFDPYTA